MYSRHCCDSNFRPSFRQLKVSPLIDQMTINWSRERLFLSPANGKGERHENWRQLAELSIYIFPIEPSAAGPLIKFTWSRTRSRCANTTNSKIFGRTTFQRLLNNHSHRTWPYLEHDHQPLTDNQGGAGTLFVVYNTHNSLTQNHRWSWMSPSRPSVLHWKPDLEGTIIHGILSLIAYRSNAALSVPRMDQSTCGGWTIDKTLDSPWHLNKISIHSKD